MLSVEEQTFVVQLLKITLWILPSGKVKSSSQRVFPSEDTLFSGDLFWDWRCDKAQLRLCVIDFAPVHQHNLLFQFSRGVRINGEINFIAAHVVVVEMLQSGSKSWSES